jgi:hypothetical protein
MVEVEIAEGDRRRGMEVYIVPRATKRAVVWEPIGNLSESTRAGRSLGNKGQSDGGGADQAVGVASAPGTGSEGRRGRAARDGRRRRTSEGSLYPFGERTAGMTRSASLAWRGVRSLVRLRPACFSSILVCVRAMTAPCFRAHLAISQSPA